MVEDGWIKEYGMDGNRTFDEEQIWFLLWLFTYSSYSHDYRAASDVDELVIAGLFESKLNKKKCKYIW